MSKNTTEDQIFINSIGAIEHLLRPILVRLYGTTGVRTGMINSVYTVVGIRMRIELADKVSMDEFRVHEEQFARGNTDASELCKYFKLVEIEER